MNSELLLKVEQIFNQAILMPPSKRDVFIRNKCGDNIEIYNQVISLISSDSEADIILEKTVFPLVAKLLEDDFAQLLKNSDFGSYKLQTLLGRGGMGAVFLGVDTRLGRSVAVKVLPKSIAENSEATLGFQHEAKIASAISHQNIAHIYEYGKCQGMHFLAMEYVPGKTLRNLLKEQQIDLSLAINIAVQICSALKAAHKKLIIHRDIKPENVMVTDENLVKVVDFGIAKLNESGTEGNVKSFETLPGLMVGTVAYMSPEQVQRDLVNERTDLWSLGVLLYEMLSGHRPFDGETPSDTQAAILSKEPQPVEIVNEIPKLGKVIDKALAKDVSERYQNAEEFLTDLKVVQRYVYDYSRQNNEKK